MSQAILGCTLEKIVRIVTVRMIVLDCSGNVAVLPFCTHALDHSARNLEHIIFGESQSFLACERVGKYLAWL